MLQKKLLKLWRTFKEGFKNFYRNEWLSIATVSILTLSLFVVSLTIVLGITTNLILKNIQEKVNISVYFNPGVTEEEILDVKKNLEVYKTEIKSIDYISAEQGLHDFLSSENSDSKIAKAVEEIGENPIPASLTITANSPDQYGIIVKAIENSDFSDKVNWINYEKNKETIDKLNRIVNLVKKIGISLGVIFILIAVLITFNTIRITIYSHKQEFEIMRLVGASNLYVRMPFVFEGIFYGISASIVAVALLFITIKFISPLTQGAIPQGNISTFYFQHFWLIFGMLLAFGSILGVISSFIAIRRYLKI